MKKDSEIYLKLKREREGERDRTNKSHFACGFEYKTLKGEDIKFSRYKITACARSKNEHSKINLTLFILPLIELYSNTCVCKE